MLLLNLLGLPASYDLGLAYRKAKVDAYYSTTFNRSSFLSYEQDLHKNLKKLASRLDGDPSKIDLGGWSLAPKSISPSDAELDLIHSSPDARWDAIARAKPKPEAEFRLMAQPSVDFHVLSALWMLKAGHRYDAKLSECAYGNRLRRKADDTVNPLSIGSFIPYLKPFRDWRDNGIRALKSAIGDGKDVVAVTADVSSYYHKLNPGFMLDADFLKAIDLELTEDEKRLTQTFVQALERWAQLTPLRNGLPVGLPASGVVANMALIELDRIIEREVVPLYYGRYVDDILLAMEDVSGFAKQQDVWEWLFRRADGMLKWADKDAGSGVSFAPSYLSDSRIQFSNKKNKVFLLAGATGKALLESIAHQVHRRASEWRALPDLPENPQAIATALVEATQNDGEAADSLRKADSVSFKRARFAIKLRDFEAYERDLPPQAWAAHRRAFLEAFTRHVLVLPTLFDLADYVPRVLRLATACEDFKLLRTMLDRLFAVVDQVARSCDISIKACPSTDCPGTDDVIMRWSKHVEGMVVDNIKASFPYRLSRTGKRDWQRHMASAEELAERLNIEFAPAELKACQREYFVHDLAHLPFRFVGLSPQLVGRRDLPPRRSIAVLSSPEELLPPAIISGIRHVAKLMRCSQNEGLPIGLLCAARPLDTHELYLLHPSPYLASNQAEVSEAILALRGFSIEKAMPCVEKDSLLQVPLARSSSKYRIGVSSWKTDIRSWVAAVMRDEDPDTTRYRRLTYLLNEVLGSPTPMDYLILPELSVPSHWFMRAAQKLRGKGISLICGVEYAHQRGRKVSNQVWAALPHDGLGFPSLAIYRQDKQRPALHEERELFRLAGLALRPVNAWRTPPVIRHGSFQFALLVCSELTNIAYRSALRGQIDALFVPEWNQDTTTFDALVESAALDIHAYIVQCNDRQYGDSRIRVPHGKSWMRDIVRLKGGENDYFVVGEIDVAALRAFQSSHRSPSGPFKPVPDGFEIAFERRALPQAES